MACFLKSRSFTKLEGQVLQTWGMPRVLRLWPGRESSASSMNIVGSTLLSIYCKAEVDIPVPWLERGDPLPKKGLKPHMSKFTQSFNASIKTWRKGRINTPGAAKQQCGNKLNYLMTQKQLPDTRYLGQLSKRRSS